MPRWLWLIALNSLLCCGCVASRGQGWLLRGESDSVKETATQQTSAPSTDAALRPTTPVSHSALSQGQVLSQPLSAPNATALQSIASPMQLAANAESPPKDLAAWNEIERAIASDPSKLNPQIQQYLREQVMAVVASQNANRPIHENSASHRTPEAIDPSYAVQQPTLPGPDPDVGSPIVDEATYRRVRKSKIPSSARASSTPPRADDVQQAAYVEESKSNSSELKNANSLDLEEGDKKYASTTSANRPPPEGNWRTSLEQTLQLVDEQLKTLPEKDKEASTLAIYARLLQTIANNHEEAVRAIEQLPAEDQEYWKHQLYALTLAIDADGKHATSRRAALVLRELREAVDRLANVSTLDVRHLAFCKSVESYGCFTEFPSHTFKAGDEVVLYVEVDNFTAEKVQDKYETEMRWTYDILDDSNKRVANVALPLDKNRCDNRRRDYFIAPKVILPRELRPGSYKLRLTVEDVKGGKSNEGSLEFRIR